MKFVVLVAAFWLLWLLAAAFDAYAADPGIPTDPLMAPTTSCSTTSSTQLLCLTNYARRKSGLVAVKGSATLYAQSKKKAQRIVECKQVSHQPCGDPFVRPPLFSSFGENLASGYTTIRGAFRAWLGSAPHRANILKSYYRLFGSARISFSSFPGSPVWVMQLGS